MKNIADEIRTPVVPSAKQIRYSIISAIIMGLTLGLLAKLVDNPNINPIFDNIGGRLGIWIFVATILSSFAHTPKLASIRVFVFFVSMLVVYYLYTVILLDFFPKNIIIFWSIVSLFSPILAYFMWFSGGSGLISNILAASPIAFILQEAYGIYLSTMEYSKRLLSLGDHLSSVDYYNMICLEIIYFCFAFIILCIFRKSKTECLVIIVISLSVSLFLIKINFSGLIFGGMNSFL